MIEDGIKNKHTLRVEFLRVEFTEEEVLLTPSIVLPGKSIMVTREELPVFITEPIALLKMLTDREKVKEIGTRISSGVFYVHVHVDQWLPYWDDKTKEK